MEVRNHLLYLEPTRQATFVTTKNLGKAINPLYLIIHYTAGTTAKGAIEWFQNPESQASAHLVIDRDGKVTQMVPFNRRAWHAGVSKWGALEDINSHSIGIEIVNAGKLSKRTDGTWLTWLKTPIPTDEVTLATHKNEQREAGWHEYTAEQIQATIDIGIVLAQKYELLDVLGHDDVAPTRKKDPGPLFPLLSVSSRILGREA